MPLPLSPGERPGMPATRLSSSDGGVGLSKVDAEQGFADAAAADRDARRGDVNAGRVAPEVAGAAAVDVEAVDGDVGRPDADHAAVAGPAKHGPIDSDQRDRSIDHQIAVVGSGRDHHAIARPRAIDERLDRRLIGRDRPAFEPALRRERVRRRRLEQGRDEKGGGRHGVPVAGRGARLARGPTTSRSARSPAARRPPPWHRTPRAGYE